MDKPWERGSGIGGGQLDEGWDECWWCLKDPGRDDCWMSCNGHLPRWEPVHDDDEDWSPHSPLRPQVGSDASQVSSDASQSSFGAGVGVGAAVVLGCMLIMALTALLCYFVRRDKVRRMQQHSRLEALEAQRAVFRSYCKMSRTKLLDMCCF